MRGLKCASDGEWTLISFSLFSRFPCDIRNPVSSSWLLEEVPEQSSLLRKFLTLASFYHLTLRPDWSECNHD